MTDAMIAIAVIAAVTYADIRGHKYVPVIAAIVLLILINGQ